MRLTILIAAHNAEAYIASALRSVLRQPLDRPAEIIVVDDGSTDGTAAVVERLARESGRIELIRTANRGVTATRNRLLQALEGREGLASFLDADDLIPENRFLQDLSLLQADPGLDLLFGAVTMFRHANAADTAPAEGSETATGRCVQLAAGTYRIKALTAVGAFDERFRQAEDMDFLLRLFERQPRYHIQRETCLYYRRHGANMTRDRDTLRRDFARALLYSVQRRRAGNLPPYPTDLFDAQNFAEAHAW